MKEYVGFTYSWSTLYNSPCPMVIFLCCLLKQHRHSLNCSYCLMVPLFLVVAFFFIVSEIEKICASSSVRFARLAIKNPNRDVIMYNIHIIHHLIFLRDKRQNTWNVSDFIDSNRELKSEQTVHKVWFLETFGPIWFSFNVCYCCCRYLLDVPPILAKPKDGCRYGAASQMRQLHHIV